MTTYEIRMHKTPGDPLWHWCVVLHAHSAGMERVVREGSDHMVEQAAGRASAEMLNLLNDDDAEIPFLDGHPCCDCATCGYTRE